jgi:hypothetical protein
MNLNKNQNKDSKQRFNRSMTLSLDKKSKTQNNLQDLSKGLHKQNLVNQQSKPKLMKNFSVGAVGTVCNENKIKKENSKPNLSKNTQNNIMVSKKVITRPVGVKMQGNSLAQPNHKNFSFPSNSKRKNTLNENNSISIIEKSKLTTMKSKIEEMFRKYSNQESSIFINSNKSVSNNNNNINLNNSLNWKKNFRETFEKEKIIDFSSSDFIPKTLNNIGSYVLKLEKFWVLWLEIIKKELNLEKLVNLFNYALSFMNDDKALKKHFNILITDLKISKKEITDFCKSKNITSKVNSSNLGQYDFLLDPSCSFNLKNNISTLSEIPVSAKTKKLSPFFGTGSEGDKLRNMNILSHSSSSSKIDGIFNRNDFSKIDFKENQESGLKKEDLSLMASSNNKAFSFYDLIQSESPLPMENNSNLDLVNNHSIPLINPKYEASYLTINETVNEETINLVNQNLHLQITESCNNISDNKNINDPSFFMRSPEVSNTSKSKFAYKTVDKSCDSYTEKLMVLTQKGNVDTKSIVQDIEKITTTLKKEIEQLRSPNVFEEENCEINVMKSCCKSTCCIVHKVYKSQNEVESENEINSGKIYGNEDLEGVSDLVVEQLSQQSKINLVDIDINSGKEYILMSNQQEDSEVKINNGETENIFNRNLAAGLEIENISFTNNIENHFSSEKKIERSENSNIENSPDIQFPREESKLIEDSFEKFLKETAKKRGEEINDYISYKNFTPKASLIGNIYTHDQECDSHKSNEKEKSLSNESNKDCESGEKENSRGNISLCLDDKKEDEELKQIIANRRRKTTTGMRKRGKSKSKSKSRSKSI